MAQEFEFECNKCQHIIGAWDDGNPYYINDAGKKKYAYHPDREAYLCIGNDTPHLCLSCGKEFMVDSLKEPVTACPKCEASTIVDMTELHGKPCPYCKEGVFEGRPGAIS